MADTTKMGGLAFFDAAGIRFHLPAYLSLAVKDPNQNVVGDLIATLTYLDEHKYNESRLAGLNATQRRCVGEVLRYLQEYHQAGGEPAIPQVDLAIDNYWNQKLG